MAPRKTRAPRHPKTAARGSRRTGVAAVSPAPPEELTDREKRARRRNRLREIDLPPIQPDPTTPENKRTEPITGTTGDPSPDVTLGGKPANLREIIDAQRPLNSPSNRTLEDRAKSAVTKEMVLAFVQHEIDCPYKQKVRGGIPGRLRMNLKVISDDELHRSLLSYRADFHYSHTSREEDFIDAGEILASRVDKPTSNGPEASLSSEFSWKDLLKPITSDTPASLKEVMLSLQALFNQNGDPYHQPADLPDTRASLREDRLMYIDIIHIAAACQNSGLLKHVLRVFKYLLRILPEWYVFHGNLILHPGIILNYRHEWNESLQEHDILEIIKRSYKKCGFEIWCYQSRERENHDVMGLKHTNTETIPAYETSPGRTVDNSESSDDSSEGPSDPRRCKIRKTMGGRPTPYERSPPLPPQTAPTVSAPDPSLTLPPYNPTTIIPGHQECFECHRQRPEAEFIPSEGSLPIEPYCAQCRALREKSEHTLPTGPS